MAEESPQSSTSTKKEEQYGLDPAIVKSLLSALYNDETKRFHELASSLHSSELTDFLSTTNSDTRRQAIAILGDQLDPHIFDQLDTDVKKDIVSALGHEQSAQVIEQLDPEDAVDVIEDLHVEVQGGILDAMQDDTREELEERLSYPDDSAGRIVEKSLVSVPEFWTVGQSIDFLRANDTLPDNFYHIFVVDPKLHPVGAVPVSQAMRSQRSVVMNDIMETNLKFIRTDMDQEEAAYIFRKYALVSAPVVNEEGRMVGVITVNDIVDVIDEEAEEDIMRMGGIKETDIHSAFLQTAKYRFPWLLINLFTAIIASIVIAYFEGTIEQIVALAVLMPIVASMGGNAGTQTVTVAVRALATKELTSANMMRVITKETIVGGLNGVLFALLTAVIIFYWYGDLQLALVFGLAVIITLMVAGLSGALIPLGLVRLGTDPAIASSVFLTTVTDVVAFAVFLGLAAGLLL